MKKTPTILRKFIALSSLGLLTLCSKPAEAQTIYSIAGIGETTGYSGDGGLATAAKLDAPYGVTLDAAGNLYFADKDRNVIRKVDVSTNIITTVVGTGVAGGSGDGSDATLARLNGPVGVSFDNSGNMYIAESDGNRVRKINTSGVISTIAGTGTASSTGDGAAATSATLNGPSDVLIDASGNIYITETAGNRIRKINTSGTISTVAGDGTASSTGDGASASSATLDGPTELAMDASGNIYVSETAGNRIRKITTSTGTISTVAGTGVSSSTGDGGAATSATIKLPSGIAFDEDGNLYISETTGRHIRKVDGSGNISTIAGTGLAGFSGDGGDPNLAKFRRPYGLAYRAGNIYLSDYNAHVIRMICNPRAPVVTASTSYCKGVSPAALVANGTNLKWYADGTTTVSSATAPTVSTATPGVYTYYVSQTSFEASCESPRAVITVTVNDLPAAPTVTTPFVYCQTTTASELSATGSNLKWYTAASGGTGSTTAPTPSTASAGTIHYYVSQTSAAADGACESPRADITVQTNAQPSTPTVSDINVCVGGATSALTATGINLTWYDAASGGTASATAPTPSSATAGTYNFYVSQTSAVADGGCESNRANLKVFVNSFPSAPGVTSTINLCKDGPASTLTATGSNLKWYDAASGGTLLSSAPTPVTGTTGTTNYYVSQSLAASAGGCEGSRSSIAVVVNALPAAPTVTSPVNLCIGGATTTLSATGTNLKWYTAASGGTGTATAPVPTTAATGSVSYYVSQTTAASSGSCEGSRAKLDVQVQPSPIVSLASAAPSGVIFCAGKTITLNATAPTATAYQWKTLGVIVPGATTNTINVGTTGLTEVEVTDVYGCKAKTDLYAQQDTSTKPILTPAEITICAGGEATLTCNPGFSSYTFDWVKDGLYSIPATPKENLKTTGAPGVYTVIVTNNFGCIDTTGTAVIANFPATVKPVISNLDPVLEVNPSYLYYQWYRFGSTISGANKNKYTVAVNGDYYVEVTDKNGCLSNSDTISVNKTTGISTIISQSAIKVYPNPAQNVVMIDAPAPINVSVNDVLGKVVLENKKVNSIDISVLNDGTYFFKIMDENDQLISVEKVTKVSR